MVDKLDTAIPAAASFRPHFGQMIEELRNTKNSPIRTSSQHYAWTADLRPYGHDAIIHMHNKHVKGGDHKIELIDTAQKSLPELEAQIHEIFVVPSHHRDSLRVMRLDLAADIKDVPVPWFKERVRVDFKRRHREEGVVEPIQQETIGKMVLDPDGFHYAEDGKQRVQTLYYGKKPNQVRIYDKHDEEIYQYQKLARVWKRELKMRESAEWLRTHDISEVPDFPAYISKKVNALVKASKQFPSFEDVFNEPEKGTIKTRFERQIGGGKDKFPANVRTFADLKNLPDYNPFANVHVLFRGQHRPDPMPYDGNGKMRRMQTHFTGLYLKRMFEEYGMQRVMDAMNQFPSRGAKKKLLSVYSDYLPDAPEREFGGYKESSGISSAQLYDFYRDSVQRQLKAA